jgi:hypothetical protein
MDLTEKFKMATFCRSVPVNKLEIERPYPILNAERSVTKYGPTIVLNIRDETSNAVKVFLP